MSYCSVIEVTPTKDDWVADYVGPTSALVAKHGGKYFARTTSHEIIEGSREDPLLRIIIEWPTKEAALGFMNDPEYAPRFKARTEGSISHHYLIEIKDDLAE